MYKDCHVHTDISHDGIDNMNTYLERAIEKNVDEIIFTEHYDIYDGIKSSLTTLDVDSYYKAYKKVKEHSDFNLGFGIEIGLQPDTFSQINSITTSYPFDFVIGSSHITCKKDMSKDPSFFEGLTREKAYLKYFREVLQNIELYNDEFDVYGHLDYVVRYGGYTEKKIEYDEFRDILDQILIALIKKDKGLEINTSGLRYGLGSPHPNKDILKRYRQLGGRIVTIGSDAHQACDLAADFDLAYDILKSANINEFAIYHKRQPQFIKIGGNHEKFKHQ